MVDAAATRGRELATAHGVFAAARPAALGSPVGSGAWSVALVGTTLAVSLVLPVAYLAAR